MLIEPQNIFSDKRRKNDEDLERGKARLYEEAGRYMVEQQAAQLFVILYLVGSLP